jgi:hypothetical protein
MYLILIFILIISTSLWHFTTNQDVYLNAPPKSCPTGYKAQGNDCIPNVSLIQSGLKFIAKNPNVSKDKIPKIYQPLVQGGYLTDRYGKWTSNYNPSGQPAAFNNTGCPNGQTKNSSGKCIPIAPPVATSGAGGCPPGQYRNPQGQCVKSSGGCPSGQVKDSKGQCVKAPSQLQPGGCPSGQIKDSKGKCVKAPPQSGGGSSGGSGGCPSGQIKDSKGKCVKAPQQSGGAFSPSETKSGLLNWAWSGEEGGSTQTHQKTKYQGQKLVLLDINAPKNKVDEAKTRIGTGGGDVIGYMSVGSIEEWRLAALKEQGYKGPGPSSSAKGPAMEEWQKKGERENWIDINNWQKAMPFIQGQMDFMKQKGFTAIEADNMSIDKNCKNKACRDKNLAFAQAVADEAHKRGMKIMMKNGSEFAEVDPNYMKQLAQTFDGLITEQSNQYKETQAYKPFTDAGKPWYNFEYENKGQTCRTTGGQTQTYYQTNNGWEQCN